MPVLKHLNCFGGPTELYWAPAYDFRDAIEMFGIEEHIDLMTVKVSFDADGRNGRFTMKRPFSRLINEILENQMVKSIRITELEIPVEQLRTCSKIFDIANVGYNYLDCIIMLEMLKLFDARPKMIRLSGNEVGSEGLDRLSAFVRDLRLAALYASGCKATSTLSARVPSLSQSGLSMLSLSLISCQTLIFLDLSYNNLDKDSIIAIKGTFAQLATLRYTNLEGNNFGDQGLLQLFGAITSRQQNASRMEYVNVSQCGSIDEENADRFVTMVESAGKGTHWPEYTNFGGWFDFTDLELFDHIGNSFAKAFHEFRTNMGATMAHSYTLVFDEVENRMMHLWKVADPNVTTDRLKVSNFSSIDQAATTSILKEFLSIAYPDADSDIKVCIQEIDSENTRCGEVDQFWNLFKEVDAVRELNVSNTGFISSFFSKMSAECSISSLDARNNFISVQGLKVTDFRTQNWAGCRDLILSNNVLQLLDSNSYKFGLFLENLCSIKSLETLDLSYNSIGDAGVAMITKKLNQTIKGQASLSVSNLVLDGIQCSSAGAIQISFSFSKNTSLTKISLKNNLIDTTGYLDVLRRWQLNSFSMMLESIDFTGNYRIKWRAPPKLRNVLMKLRPDNAPPLRSKKFRGRTVIYQQMVPLILNSRKRRKREHENKAEEEKFDPGEAYIVSGRSVTITDETQIGSFYELSESELNTIFRSMAAKVIENGYSSRDQIKTSVLEFFCFDNKSFAPLHAILDSRIMFINLDYSYRRISEIETRFIFNLLSCITPSEKFGLKSINMSHNALGDKGAICLFDHMSKTRNHVKDVALRNCQLTNALSSDESFKRVMSQNTLLQRLDLSLNYDIGEQFHKNAAKAIKLNENSKLKVLKIPFNDRVIRDNLLDWDVDLKYAKMFLIKSYSMSAPQTWYVDKVENYFAYYRIVKEWNGVVSKKKGKRMLVSNNADFIHNFPEMKGHESLEHICLYVTDRVDKTDMFAHGKTKKGRNALFTPGTSTTLNPASALKMLEMLQEFLLDEGDSVRKVTFICPISSGLGVLLEAFSRLNFVTVADQELNSVEFDLIAFFPNGKQLISLCDLKSQCFRSTFTLFRSLSIFTAIEMINLPKFQEELIQAVETAIASSERLRSIALLDALSVSDLLNDSAEELRLRKEVLLGEALVMKSFGSDNTLEPEEKAIAYQEVKENGREFEPLSEQQLSILLRAFYQRGRSNLPYLKQVRLMGHECVDGSALIPAFETPVFQLLDVFELTDSIVTMGAYIELLQAMGSLNAALLIGIPRPEAFDDEIYAALEELSSDGIEDLEFRKIMLTSGSFMEFRNRFEDPEEEEHSILPKQTTYRLFNKMDTFHMTSHAVRLTLSTLTDKIPLRELMLEDLELSDAECISISKCIRDNTSLRQTLQKVSLRNSCVTKFTIEVWSEILQTDMTLEVLDLSSEFTAIGTNIFTETATEFARVVVEDNATLLDVSIGQTFNIKVQQIKHGGYRGKFVDLSKGQCGVVGDPVGAILVCQLLQVSRMQSLSIFLTNLEFPYQSMKELFSFLESNEDLRWLSLRGCDFNFTEKVTNVFFDEFCNNIVVHPSLEEVILNEAPINLKELHAIIECGDLYPGDSLALAELVRSNRYKVQEAYLIGNYIRRHRLNLEHLLDHDMPKEGTVHVRDLDSAKLIVACCSLQDLKYIRKLELSCKTESNDADENEENGFFSSLDPKTARYDFGVSGDPPEMISLTAQLQIIKLVRSLPNLKEFRLVSHFLLPETVQKLADALRSHPKIKMFTLNKAKIPIRPFRSADCVSIDFGSDTRIVEEESAGHVFVDTNPMVFEDLQLQSKADMLELQNLQKENREIMSAAVVNLVCGLTEKSMHVKDLSLANSQMLNKEFNKLLSLNLRSIKASGCLLTSKGLVCPFDDPLVNLKHLSVSHNDLSSNGYTALGILIQQAPNLKLLFANHCILGPKVDPLFLKSLQSSTSLEHVHLEGNSIENFGSQLIMKCFSTNKLLSRNILSVNLSYNMLDDNVAPDVSKYLIHRCPNVEVLIRGNKFTAKVIIDLMTEMKRAEDAREGTEDDRTNLPPEVEVVTFYPTFRRSQEVLRGSFGNFNRIDRARVETRIFFHYFKPYFDTFDIWSEFLQFMSFPFTIGLDWGSPRVQDADYEFWTTASHDFSWLQYFSDFFSIFRLQLNFDFVQGFMIYWLVALFYLVAFFPVSRENADYVPTKGARTDPSFVYPQVAHSSGKSALIQRLDARGSKLMVVYQVLGLLAQSILFMPVAGTFLEAFDCEENANGDPVLGPTIGTDSEMKCYTTFHFGLCFLSIITLLPFLFFVSRSVMVETLDLLYNKQPYSAFNWKRWKPPPQPPTQRLHFFAFRYDLMETKIALRFLLRFLAVTVGVLATNNIQLNTSFLLVVALILFFIDLVDPPYHNHRANCVKGGVTFSFLMTTIFALAFAATDDYAMTLYSAIWLLFPIYFLAGALIYHAMGGVTTRFRQRVRDVTSALQQDQSLGKPIREEDIDDISNSHEDSEERRMMMRALAIPSKVPRSKGLPISLHLGDFASEYAFFEYASRIFTRGTLFMLEKPYKTAKEGAVGMIVNPLYMPIEDSTLPWLCSAIIPSFGYYVEFVDARKIMCIPDAEEDEIPEEDDPDGGLIVMCKEEHDNVKVGDIGEIMGSFVDEDGNLVSIEVMWFSHGYKKKSPFDSLELLSSVTVRHMFLKEKQLNGRQSVYWQNAMFPSDMYYKAISDFEEQSDYIDYLSNTLSVGSIVATLAPHGPIEAGDSGIVVDVNFREQKVLVFSIQYFDSVMISMLNLKVLYNRPYIIRPNFASSELYLNKIKSFLRSEMLVKSVVDSPTVPINAIGTYVGVSNDGMCLVSWNHNKTLSATSWFHIDVLSASVDERSESPEPSKSIY